jgi:hypothetical protein
MTQEPSPQQPILHHRARHETVVFSRLQSNQDRVADAITRFAGQHVLRLPARGLVRRLDRAQRRLVGSALVFDDFPFGLLTMIVSLEAIFLSTFVMISQNREASTSRGARQPRLRDQPDRGGAWCVLSPSTPVSTWRRSTRWCGPRSSAPSSSSPHGAPETAVRQKRGGSR